MTRFSNSTRLDPAFLRLPIAHRGLHHIAWQENSILAVEAAIKAGFAVEVDLQCSKDNEAFVFHDYQLERLTSARGILNQISGHNLDNIRLKNGDPMWRFGELLDLVDSHVPLLVEIKSPDIEHLSAGFHFCKNIAKSVQHYSGPIAFMSFNPFIAQSLRSLLPNHAIGLVTDDFQGSDWDVLSDHTRLNMQNFTSVENLEIDFISHNWTDLARVAHCNCPIFCWTIKSQAEADVARKIAHNITFEGYLPKPA